MRTEIIAITPKMAQAWLHPSVNHDNRTVSKARVDKLAKIMIAGKFQATHQGIAFSESGRLLDGQHRLSAIVMAGITVTMMVTRDMSEECFSAIDEGGTRSFAQRLHLVDSVMENEMICTAIRGYLKSAPMRSSVNVISVDDIEDEFLVKSASWEWMSRQMAHKSKSIRQQFIAASFAIYHHINADKAALAMDRYLTGANLDADSPILKLRNFAISGTFRDVGYWRVQAMLRADLVGTTPRTVVEPAEDMLGNLNSGRLLKKREQAGIKGAETKRKQTAA